MEKHFDDWNHQKKIVDARSEAHFREGDIWWIWCGLNIGIEIDGKGENYRRPVLILKKFNKFGFLAIPLSTVAKTDQYVVPIGSVAGKLAFLNISQIRSMSSKRLSTHIQSLDRAVIADIRKITRNILFSGDFHIAPFEKGKPGWPTEK